ncbi:MAG TPA: hypothetical protein VGL11_13380 [Candidatus Binatia bacterium]
MATEQSRNQSYQPQQKVFLKEVSWEEIEEPGTYAERGSGDLYRIPQEALVRGASPVIQKQSNGSSRMVKLSTDPFLTTLQAKLKCAEHNISPNF